MKRLILFVGLSLSAQPITTITVAGKEYRLEFVTKVTQACEPERNCRGPKRGTFVKVYSVHDYLGHAVGIQPITEVRLYDPALIADHAKAIEYVRTVIADKLKPKPKK